MSGSAQHDARASRPLILIPTYNERENLELLSDAIAAARPDAHALVIDDNSPDGTGALADALADARPDRFVLHRPGKQGLGRAYLAGFAWALAAARGYTHIIQMDADFSHDPRYLDALLSLCAGEDARADVAIGSRWVPGGGVENWGLHRRLLSRGGSLYARAILGLGVRDVTAGFVCYRREVLERLDLDEVEANGYGFQIEMKFRCARLGFRLRETPIVFPDRARGDSKMSPAIMLEAIGLVWKLRRKPIRGRARSQ
ncbi:MAG: polyprenol monophosphomannose synthase [Myxococcales bacterium]|nr:polyprenol monophosphomannose synthase [Myxococcales bacterium]